MNIDHYYYFYENNLWIKNNNNWICFNLIKNVIVNYQKPYYNVHFLWFRECPLLTGFSIY